MMPPAPSARIGPRSMMTLYGAHKCLKRKADSQSLRFGSQRVIGANRLK